MPTARRSMNFHANLLLVFLYVAWRFVAPLPISFEKRIFIGAGLFLISKYHLVLLIAYGTMFSPELPFALVFVAGWAFCAFVLLALLTLLADLISVAHRAMRIFGSKPMFTWRIRAGIAILSITMGGWGVVQAVQVPNINHFELVVEDWPVELDGFHLVQLTDLHISRLFQAPWVREVVNRTNTLDPDLIVITGDLIDGTTSARRVDIEPLAGLSARDGVIAIPGNHEYYFDSSLWVTEFERLGMRMLLNEHVVVGQGRERIVLAGVTDEAAPAYGFEGPNLTAALSEAPTGVPKILLKHRPENAEASAAAGVDVQLSGHTHGGMIRGFDLIAAYANQGFVSGRYRVDDMTLYVSNGTGLWNGFPIRLGVPAEITSIRLRTKS